ncbi:dihydrolipoamide acetyltransferase family protein [Arthrobacter sp. MDT2-2]
MTAAPGTAPGTAPATAAPGTESRIREFRLPDLGEGLTESEILQWHVAEGDTVELNQIIADVETAKAVVELPSPYAGVVVRLHEAAGTVVDVGSPIVSFEVASDDDAPVPQAQPSASSAPYPPASAISSAAGSAVSSATGSVITYPAESDEAPARREPNLVGYGAAVEKGGRPQRRNRTFRPTAPEASVPPAPVPTAPPVSAAVQPAAPVTSPVPPASPAVFAPAAPIASPASPGAPANPGMARSGERPRSTPPVRKLARDLGITLDALTGTGPGALITREDVLAALAGTAGSPVPPSAASAATASPGAAPVTSAALAAPPASAPPTAPSAAAPAPPTGTASPHASAGEARTPIRGMRKHTAAAMVASAFTAPHVTEFLTIDVTPTMDLLAELKGARAFEGAKVTPLTIVAKAVCIAIARNPTLNSSWDEAAQEIVQYADVNLGIAAATPRGLLVPNIKAAQALTLVDLARAIATLTETARAGRTLPADLAGGTVSITNIGVFGIDAGTPILNPGEAAILAVGAVRSMPWEYQGTIALRSVLTLSLSFDHRLVDGEQGSRFLADVGAILRNPAMVLTMI